MLAAWRNRQLVPRLGHLEPSSLDRVIRRACRKYRAGHTVLGIVALPTLLLAIIVSYCAFLIGAIAAPGGASGIIARTFAVVGFLVPGLCLGLIWVQEVRRSVSRFLRDRECWCKYDLRGVPIQDEAAVCPECGTVYLLSDFGLASEMLQGGAIDSSPTSSAAG